MVYHVMPAAVRKIVLQDPCCICSFDRDAWSTGRKISSVIGVPLWLANVVYFQGLRVLMHLRLVLPLSFDIYRSAPFFRSGIWLATMIPEWRLLVRYISSSGKDLANQHSSHKDGDETTLHTKIANPTSRCRFEVVEDVWYYHIMCPCPAQGNSKGQYATVRATCMRCAIELHMDVHRRLYGATQLQALIRIKSYLHVALGW